MSLPEFLAEQWLLLLLASALLIALIVNEWVLSSRSGPRVGPAAAVRLINDRQARIIDLRSAQDFKRGRILGAENAPPNRIAEVEAELLKSPDSPVLLVDALGSQAASVARRLRSAGHRAVHPLGGGLNAWEAAGMPLTRQTNSKSGSKGGAKPAKVAKPQNRKENAKS